MTHYICDLCRRRIGENNYLEGYGVSSDGKIQHTFVGCLTHVCWDCCETIRDMLAADSKRFKQGWDGDMNNVPEVKPEHDRIEGQQ